MKDILTFACGASVGAAVVMYFWDRETTEQLKEAEKLLERLKRTNAKLKEVEATLG